MTEMITRIATALETIAAVMLARYFMESPDVLRNHGPEIANMVGTVGERLNSNITTGKREQ
jgi:hypothetical protein